MPRPGKGVAHAKDEAQRRAAILRRYVALDRPSADDDKRFAEELGLKKETLYALARSWRLHADPTLLPGAFTRTASGDRKLAYKATENPDLSGVNPTRRTAVRERISELRRFLSIAAPTRADEIRSAKRLGMEPIAFRRLHRSWMLARDPAALPGASTQARVPRRLRPAVSAEGEALIAATIAELGPEASALAVHRAVMERCRSAAIDAPTKLTVYSRVVETRGRTTTPLGTAAIAVDHVAIQLPVQGPAGPQFPVLSAVLDVASSHILTFDLALAAPEAASTTRLLADAVGQGRGAAGDPLTLELASPKEPDWDALIKTLKAHGVVLAPMKNRTLLPGRHLMRMFGGRMERFPLRPGLTTRPASARIRSMGRANTSLSLEEAREVIGGMVKIHNLNHPRQAFRSFVPQGRIDELVHALN